jgi:hypothetical protein
MVFQYKTRCVSRPLPEKVLSLLVRLIHNRHIQKNLDYLLDYYGKQNCIIDLLGIFIYLVINMVTDGTPIW